ncbi:efflux RND transporter permease subunit [Candidatus Methylacidithermus pantelleriae]|uniref:CzcA family heavy metal efflux pump/hydrophobe/amphiphile efflux-1 (HAE1) family protein n=1 Tax=Candidatus Methylacidithermus pantelleriae TaxID=2744239 RepID=A0A8J2BRV4_9BACT|nr:efflux RND transporter permease subunit [Candidatus Methylacidithermus pantelleriae]CAF0693453.1 CzcA family heavy metal efflux pump/hydrophobe/amphiphile efflux-1 (HAE1) family protein [Candidatus Methylacidithermus pantelleriae]
MTLPELSIRRPVFAWMLMAALILFGTISLSRMGISQLPEIDFPVLTINLMWPGATPETMETEIVDPVEQAIISADGLRQITSYIQQGQASVILEFDVSRNIDAALTEVQSKLSAVKLPADANLPILVKDNPEDQPILLLGLASSRRSLRDLVVYVDLYLHDTFQIVPGVAEITLFGFTERNLRVWVQNEKLKPLQLTILDVQTALQQEQVEVAAGYVENQKKELNVRAMAEGLTPEQVGAIQIKRRGTEPIYQSRIRIRDVARVEDGLNDVRRLAVLQGGVGLALGIKKQPGANTVAVARAVKKKLEEIRPTLPSDIELKVVYDTTRYIEDSVNETLFTLFLSAIVTGLACFLFLGSWSSTLNVLFAIPTSVMGSFIVMYFMGFTRNFFTLLGLSLAIGIVVDDAIMVLENIVRHREQGLGRVAAARLGANEITFAAIAASVAIMAIFLPVAFMQGIIGQYFFQFGVTISAAVAFSLLEAVTLTPMRCSQLLEPPNRARGLPKMTAAVFGYLARIYRKTLESCLRHPGWVLAGSALAFAVSLAFLRTLPREFLPPQDTGYFLLRVQAPIGSSLEFTTRKLIQCEELLRKHPEVASFFGQVGGPTFRTGAPAGNLVDSEVNVGTIYVSLVPRERRRKSQAQLMRELREELQKIPSLRITVQDLSSRAFTTGRGFPVELSIRGSNYEQLQKIAHRVMEKLAATHLFEDLDTDFRTGMPEVRVFPDRVAAAAYGVPITTIANTVAAAIGGVTQSQFTNGERRYDIRIRLDAGERVRPEDILKLDVRTITNEVIPIRSVVKLETVPTHQTLVRRQRQRAITLFANVAPNVSQAEALQVAERVARKELPSGFQLYLTGGAQSFREAFSSLSFAMWLGVVISYMVLASQFNSLIYPLVILLALPFSLTGALLALYLTRQSLNLYSMIGMVLLMGIAKKNSILLVDFANRRREEGGLSPKEALLEAGPIRLRPILMTSFATLAAAIPPALALGPGTESRVPMAVTILGGVLVSTLFTLLVVPCAYLVVSREGPRRPAYRAQKEPLTGKPEELGIPATPLPRSPSQE